MAYDLLLRRQTKRDWSCPMFVTVLGSDDPLVWTRSAVKAEMLRILGILDAVNLDVSRARGENKLSDAEWKQWRATYLSGHKFLTTASHYWGSNVIAARKHESEALKWRDFVASKGGSLQGPSLGRPADFPTTKVALAVGGVAAAAFLITSLRKKY